MKLEHISNYTELAKKRIVEQYKDRPLFESFLTAQIEGVQKIEDDLWQVYTKRWIDKAEGFSLDICGKIAGIERGLKDDAEYRIAIYAQIELNTSGGDAESIINIIKQFYKTEKITFRDVFPAAFSVELDSEIFIENIKEYLQTVAAAGVRVNNVIQSFVDNTLILSELPSSFPQIQGASLAGRGDFQVTLQEGVFDIYATTASIDNEFEIFLDELYLNDSLAEVGIEENYLVFENDSFVAFDLNASAENYTISDFGHISSEVL